MHGRSSIGRQNKVLMIGGSTLSRLMVETIFAASADFAVVAIVNEVSDLENAVEDHRADLVLVDLCSGKIDGVAALNTIASQRYLKKIILSVEALPGPERDRLAEAGAHGFFEKRVVVQDHDSFLAHLRSLTNKPATNLASDDEDASVEGLPMIATGGPESMVLPASAIRSPPSAGELVRSAEVETMRQAALHALGIMNNKRDRRLDLLMKHLCNVTGYPMAAVTLIDGSIQWIKAATGLERTLTPRAQAICDYTIRSQAPMIVADTFNHPIFSTFDCVTGVPHVRSYVGVPLVVEYGFAVGALCIIDTQPRTWVQSEIAILNDLAALIVSMLDDPA